MYDKSWQDIYVVFQNFEVLYEKLVFIQKCVEIFLLIPSLKYLQLMSLGHFWQKS